MVYLFWLTHEKLNKLENMEIDLLAPDGVSRAEKCQELVEKFYKRRDEIRYELEEYFDTENNEEQELIEIKATKSSTLNKLLSSHINNQLTNPDAYWT
jgi:hypothetical protein